MGNETMKVAGVLLVVLAIAASVGVVGTAKVHAQAQGSSGTASTSGASDKGQTAQGSAESPGSEKTGIAVKEDAPLVEKQKATYPLGICVVSGGKLGGDGEPVDYLYKGRLVRFCCAECIAAFEKDPAKCLAKLDAAAKTKEKAEAGTAKESSAATAWTCPMHPEVHGGKPGKCPKCGMNLVKAAAGSTTKAADKK